MPYHPKVGQYFYAPYKRQWAVWKLDMIHGSITKYYVKSVPTKAKAISEVGILNGWTK